MPRPCKQRRVCGHPPCGRFGPAGQDAGPEVVMGVDEFEAIRLIDLEGLTQEECAAQMNVARTTVQAIYAQARVKLARCLVGGCALSIRGGDYARGDIISFWFNNKILVKRVIALPIEATAIGNLKVQMKIEEE